MFEDIIDSSPPQEAKSMKWDFDKYVNEAYCYSCGSKNVKITYDKLSNKQLENDMQCLICGAKWREIWDADINLDLKELKIECLKI